MLTGCADRTIFAIPAYIQSGRHPTAHTHAVRTKPGENRRSAQSPFLQNCLDRAVARPERVERAGDVIARP